MKIRISYFYQIRYFQPYMLPMSTAIYDPKWYHNFKNDDYIFFDKRGILNGIRATPIIDIGKQYCADSGCTKNCKQNPQSCNFIKTYREALETMDYDSFIKRVAEITNYYAKTYKIKEEIIAVLMVYEAPANPCSERQPLIDYFNKHGMECEELNVIRQ